MINKNLPPEVREKALETEMRGLGILQYRRIVKRAREREREGTTRHGLVLIKAALDRVANGITSFLAEVNQSGRGALAGSAPLLSRVDPRVAALVGLRVVVDGILVHRPVAALATEIGKRLEDEVRFQCFRAVSPLRFHRVKEEVKKASTHRRKRTVGIFRANRLGVDWPDFTITERVRAGMKLIELIAGTGYIELRVKSSGIGKKQKTQRVVRVTPKLKRWIAEQTARCEVLCPRYLPSYLPPKPWNQGGRGGYHYPGIVGDHFFMKTHFSEHRKLVERALPSIPLVLGGLNVLQATPWAVNQRVLEVARAAWDAGLQIEGLPSREDLPLPPRPYDIDTNDDARRKWRRATAPVWDYNSRAVAKRILVARTLWIAEQFVDEPTIYFPHQLDFRGRAYTLPSGLSPQGTDLAKGLLHFGEAVPLGDDVAAGWLAIHGANSYGYDKAPLEERIAYIEAMNEEILAIAAEPLEHTSWTRADAPFQFLAFCFEWAEYLRTGNTFASRLAVAMDASCSGIQHFSAMVRDEVGGASVNLVGGDQKQDIYQRVCDRFIALLRAELADTETLAYQSADGAPVSVANAARIWLSLKPDRTTTKAQVMTTPYGSTRNAHCRQTEDWLRERRKLEIVELPRDDLFPLANFGAKRINEAIGKEVEGAKKVMRWLQDCASVMSQAPGYLHWRTPSGFPVYQHYSATRKTQVRTALGDTAIRLTFREETERKDGRDMRMSIAPNFVHALDAAHLFLTVDYAVANGISHLAAVHDSFGCHAAYANKFAAIIREAFVDLYEGHDVLTEFRDALLAQLPPKLAKRLPALSKLEFGTLDLNTVRKSQFFFS
ncbi:hypothetical protein GIW81_00975 [Hyphomicrobium sp. xq]|uniref:DNA-directed RNA polymerase n=1 Tax=Hyphomicrobium album TaxID=2665159 RepID=A0A6I3KJG1_9HYPH|nr:DNA-directed RNA polymerase [Hyphomicrobium album]MTD92901.1 hypothetical protein [Hyphomicrobium album]